MKARFRAALIAVTRTSVFSLAQRVGAGNLLLADPDFDDGIGAWMTGAAQTSTVTADADSCPASYAFRVAQMSSKCV